MQDSTQKFEDDPTAKRSSVDDKVTEKEVTERSSPRRGPKPVVHSETIRPAAAEIDGSDKRHASDETEVEDLLKNDVNPGSGALEEAKSDDLHKVIVHDNDDWKPPALTTYGEVRYVPTHEYEGRRDPDAIEPPAVILAVGSIAV